ncbi:MAG: hypothetical protein GOV01_01885 [Candidatus Altiarchaeota archaeon]|nr:hypothetical protein [Candidatus Altiarchaeota archaeon]
MIESVAILIVMAAFFGLLLSLMNFSPSPAYLFAGFLAAVIGISGTELSVLSEFGVIMLLFSVGIEMNILKIFKSFRVIFVAIVQMVGTFFFTYILSTFMGITGMDRLILSLAFVFSSTAIVLKTLSDKGLLDSALGELSVGILILEDIVAALVISFISGAHTSPLGIGALAIFLVVSKKVFDFLSTKQQISLETVFMISIAVAMGSSAIAGTVGLSYGMGALFAGIALSFIDSKHEVLSLFQPLKDFFLLLFFIFIGGFVQLDNLKNLVFLVVPLIITPLTIFIPARIVGIPKRIAVLASITLANLSEFSLVVVWAASSAGMISQNVVGIVALTAMISMLVSPILLQVFLRQKSSKEVISKEAKAEIYLFGAHDTGRHILESLGKKDVVVVDSNSSHVRQLRKKKYNAILGDVGSVNFLSSQGIENVKIVISTVPDVPSNTALLEYLSSKKSEAIVILVSHCDKAAKILRSKGADVVVLPKRLAGKHISAFMKELSM